MIVPISAVGQIGQVSDLPAFDLPPNAWTSVVNARMAGVEVTRPYGSSSVFVVIGSTLDPLDLFYYDPGTGTRYVIFAQAASLYASGNNGVPLDVTRAVGGPYSASTTEKWNGGSLSGIMILNNGVDVPQQWDVIGGATAFSNLANWPSTARAKVVRPFKTFLVALDVTKSSVRDQRMVKWSHPAASLTVPASWDEADPTVDAGEVSLGDGQDPLMDCLPLGNVNVIYSENQTWLMAESGGDSIFSFALRFPTFGLLWRGCAVSFPFAERGGAEHHFVITQDDIRVHDGSSSFSIATDRVRAWFFDQLTQTSRKYVRVLRHDLDDEIWIFYPNAGGTVANSVLVWSYRYNTWYQRSIVATKAAVASHQGGPFSTKLGPRVVYWDSTTLATLIDNSPDYNGFYNLNATSVIERKSLPIKGGSGGQPILDEDRRAMLRRVWPRFSGSTAVVSVEVGWQETRQDAITWLTAKNFTIGQTLPVDFIMPYRYLSIRFTIPEGAVWTFKGFDLEIELLGKL